MDDHEKQARERPHVEELDSGDLKLAASNNNINSVNTTTTTNTITATAATATQIEHQLTLRLALHHYWKAIAWSVIVSLGTVMDSYDTQLINSFFAYPSFQQKFGEALGAGRYSIPAPWQIALSLAPNIGIVLGGFANGWLTDRFGPKKVIAVAYVVLSAFIFITFFAQRVQTVLVGVLLCGIPWGVFAALTPAYAAEVAPMVLRPYLTTFVNLCWVIGHLIATGILQGLVDVKTEWGWRIPIAIQWVWPVILFPLALFAPQSPWWLVRQNRLDEAETQLNRLISNPDDRTNAKTQLSLIVHTLQVERDMNIGTTYVECFRGINLRRTEIAVIGWACQILPGFAIQNYTTYFFTIAGLAPPDAFKLSLGVFSIAFVGTVSSWFIMARFGRRSIYLVGLLCMVPIMLTVGFLDLAPRSSSVQWAQSGLLLIWFGCYGASIGPVPYVFATEIPASQLRVKTVSLARNGYSVLSIINTVVAPYMLNPTAGNLRGKAAFPAAAFTIGMIVWAYFRLPETKGRTYEEIDILFDRQVPARQFKGYRIESHLD